MYELLHYNSRLEQMKVDTTLAYAAALQRFEDASRQYGALAPETESAFKDAVAARRAYERYAKKAYRRG